MRAEERLLQALAKGDLEQVNNCLTCLLKAADGRIRHAFFAATVRAHLSNFDLPALYVEYMEIARTAAADLELRIMSCVQATFLAFKLQDPRRMKTAYAQYQALCRSHRSSPLIRKWQGQILLNRANLAHLWSDRHAIGLYRKACHYLRQQEDYWCQLVAALSSVAVLYERAGRPRAADRALREAEAASRGPANRQEILLARGHIALRRGQPDEARRCSLKVLDVVEVERDPRAHVEALVLLAQTALYVGDRKVAVDYSQQARRLAVDWHLYHLLELPVLRMDQSEPERGELVCGVCSSSQLLCSCYST